jgi:hypothetical protein
MKVNPLGIQAYQHLTRQDKPAAERPDSAVTRAGEEKVVIEPQPSVSKSALAVKAPSGDYSKFLAPEERQALDLLFSRFSDSSRFGPGYSTDVDANDNDSGLGRMVDVKV